MQVEKYIQDLEETWDMTTEQLEHVRLCLAMYAADALHDKEVAREVWQMLEYTAS